MDHGKDSTTFAPFVLHNALDAEWNDVRLEFSAWNWAHSHYGETIEGYYLNGYGVEGLVKTVRFSNGLDAEPDSIHYNSEGDACYIHFESLDEALLTARLAAAMVSSESETMAMVALAQQEGWDDG